MTKEALTLALKALEGFHPEFVCQATHHKRKDQHNNFEPCPNVAKYDEAIVSIKKALAQPEQSWTPERIAGMARLKKAQDKKLAQPEQKPMHPQLKAMLEEYFDKCFAESAPQRTWVGLTEQDKMEISDKLGLMDVAWLDLMEAIEVKLKANNYE